MSAASVILSPMAGNRFRRAIDLVQATAASRGFRVALIGGFALPFHGIQRATGDVDFLVDEEGGDALDAALVEAGARRLHRSPDAANYAPGSSDLCAVDFLYARRPLAREMLRRAARQNFEGGGEVAVVDAEALIGLKLQAIANAPGRRDRDQADIRALLSLGRGRLDVDLLRQYFVLFDRERELDEWLKG